MTDTDTFVNRSIGVLFQQLEVLNSSEAIRVKHVGMESTVVHMLSHHVVVNEEDRDLLRVYVDDDGKFDIVDFTTPSKDGRFLFRNAPQESIPQWVIEAISLLRITEPRCVVRSIGFKLHDRLYYIVDKRGEYEAN